MYNGIGLTTVRGSGTNGYVQRNLSFVRRRQKFKTLEETEFAKPAILKQPNKDIMEHNRKRQVELEVVKYQMLLEAKE